MTKIMLVEDDNNLREIYGARLSAEGYEIVSARDGEEALALSVKEKPDLIVTDVMMPKISGYDMLDILRSTPETKDTKVIMMTALSQKEDQERGEKLGADRYLVKSQVTLEDVVRVVGEVLGGVSADQTATTSVAATPEPAPSPVAPAAGAIASTEPTNHVPAAEPIDTTVASDNQATSAPEPTTNYSPATEPTPSPVTPPVDNSGSKKPKVIEPLNDTSQATPDIQDLLEKEAAKTAAETLSPGQAVGPQQGASSIADEKAEIDQQISAALSESPATESQSPPTPPPSGATPPASPSPPAPPAEGAPEQNLPNAQAPAENGGPNPNDIAL